MNIADNFEILLFSFHTFCVKTSYVSPRPCIRICNIVIQSSSYIQLLDALLPDIRFMPHRRIKLWPLLLVELLHLTRPGSLHSRKRKAVLRIRIRFILDSHIRPYKKPGKNPFQCHFLQGTVTTRPCFFWSCCMLYVRYLYKSIIKLKVHQIFFGVILRK